MALTEIGSDEAVCHAPGIPAHDSASFLDLRPSFIERPDSLKAVAPVQIRSGLRVK